MRSAASTITTGDLWWTWSGFVSATVKVGALQIRSGSDTAGPGEFAGLDWTDLPSARGVGTYRLDSTHRATSTCGDVVPRQRTLTLDVLKPAITTNPGGGAEVSGIWWLGGGQNPDNGFFNIVDFHAIPNYSPVETSPIWIVTQNPTKISLNCTACNVTRATRIRRSDSERDIQVRVVVGGVGGLASDPVPFTVNYPKQVVFRGENTFGMLDGYETRFFFQTLDIMGRTVPRIAMNEIFLNPQDPTPNNWPEFESKGFPFPMIEAGNIWVDKVSMFSSVAQPDLNPTVVPQDDTVVQQAGQEWRVGSVNIGSGVFLLRTDLKRRRGFATNDPRTFIPVP